MILGPCPKCEREGCERCDFSGRAAEYWRLTEEECRAINVELEIDLALESKGEK